MLIIGLTGTIGSGKGTVVEYLTSKKNFKHYSMSGYLKDELAKRNKVADRENLRFIGNELRTINGPQFVVSELYKKAIMDEVNAVIESIRNPKEAEFIKQNGGILISVDADIKIRYQRIKSRGSEKDFVSFEEFKLQEEKEFQKKDLNSQNLGDTITLADYKINNDGDLKSLYKQIDNIIRKIE